MQHGSRNTTSRSGRSRGRCVSHSNKCSQCHLITEPFFLLGLPGALCVPDLPARLWNKYYYYHPHFQVKKRKGKESTGPTHWPQAKEELCSVCLGPKGIFACCGVSEHGELWGPGADTKTSTPVPRLVPSSCTWCSGKPRAEFGKDHWVLF